MKTKQLEEFIKISYLTHGNKYDYSNVVYINNYSKVEIICPIHGKFWQTPKNHYRSGCKLCADIKKSNHNFISNAIEVHDKKYDYSKVEYINQLIPVSIICPIHGIFEQIPKVHLNGSGCRKCFDDSNHPAKGIEKFLEESVAMHGLRYDYSMSHYFNNKTPIIIICKEHGEFYQSPFSHLLGAGCPECLDTKKLTLKKFVARANMIHNHKYDYSKTIWINGISKIEIICPAHGNFLQVAQDHVSGHGCYKCYKNISKMETDWLDDMKVPDDQDHRNVYLIGNNRKYKVDGYVNGIVYEFYGDFWHGNPIAFDQIAINSVNKMSFGQLYQNTIQREKELTELGFKVKSIWEHDWKKLNET